MDTEKKRIEGDVPQEPVVTVLLASYNHQNYVADSILSIVNQTYKNIELIVIDDGSSDSSQKIIKSLGLEYGFMSIFQENRGLSDVLNRGLKMAKGKYFISVSSDDLSLLDRVEKQVKFLENNESFGICAGNQIVIDESGLPVKKQSFLRPRKLVFEDIFLHNNSRIEAPTVMCRTDILRQVGGYNKEVHLEDLYMWLKVTNAGEVVYVMGDILAYYRKHSMNKSKDLVFMADSLESIYSEYSNHPNYKKTLNKLLANLAAKSVRRKNLNTISLFKRVELRFYSLKLCSLFFMLLINKLMSCLEMSNRKDAE